MQSIIFLLVLVFVNLLGKAQDRNDINLFTDRDMYASGENIWCKVYLPLDEQSTILHLDLINYSGNRVAGIIKKFQDHQSNGFVYLPDSLSSGYYLLRASTRTGPKMTFKEIYVANRFFGLSASDSVLRPSGVVPFVQNTFSVLRINGIENNYQTRADAHVSIEIPKEFLSQIEGDLLVSIANELPGYNTRTFALDANPTTLHIPEKDGIIIEGIVSDKASNQPVDNVLVYLSIPDSSPAFNYYITGADGRFFFELKNNTGKVLAVIQCFDKKQNHLLKIMLYYPEDEREELPLFETWKLPETLTKIVKETTLAVNFRKIFKQQNLIQLPGQNLKHDNHPFYEKATNTVYPGFFVDLPDFSEISRELLPGVKFRISATSPSLRVFSPNLNDFFNEPPLLLIDGIPILDLDLIKNLTTKDIEKIEICRDERFIGDLNFAGVLAIYTSKTDNSLILESEELLKINLETLQTTAILPSTIEQPTNEPDFRQVLLWNPSVKPAQAIQFDFRTSDIRGNYKLMIRGKTKDNSTFYKEQIFEVN